MSKKEGFVFVGVVVLMFFLGARFAANYIEKREVEPFGDPTFVTHLVTNYHVLWDPSENVVVYDHRNRIFDLGAIVYSQEFADEHHLPSSNVSEELSDGMHVMEFRMITVGGYINCYLNMLLDQGLDLDLPSQNYAAPSWGELRTFDFPKQNDGIRTWILSQKYAAVESTERYYDRNTRLRSKNRSGSQFFERYNEDYYDGRDYITVSLYCSKRHYSGENLEFWYKKKGMPNLLKQGGLPEYYLKFRIPEYIREKAFEFTSMEGIDTHRMSVNLKKKREKYEKRKRLGLPKSD